MNIARRILSPFTGALIAALSAPCGADTVVSAANMTNALTIENLQMNDGAVNGEIVNRTQHRLENIELRVTYDWLWRNEFKPGDVSPAWTTTFRAPATLAPGEKYEFHYAPEQPLTARDDGRFSPSVGVVSYTEFASGEAR